MRPQNHLVMRGKVATQLVMRAILRLLIRPLNQQPRLQPVRLLMRPLNHQPRLRPLRRLWAIHLWKLALRSQLGATAGHDAPIAFGHAAPESLPLLNGGVACRPSLNGCGRARLRLQR